MLIIFRTQNNSDQSNQAILYTSGGQQNVYGIPTSLGTNFQAAVRFPSCWDGVNVDSSDHKSHVHWYSTSFRKIIDSSFRSPTPIHQFQEEIPKVECAQRVIHMPSFPSVPNSALSLMASQIRNLSCSRMAILPGLDFMQISFKDGQIQQPYSSLSRTASLMTIVHGDILELQMDWKSIKLHEIRRYQLSMRRKLD